MSKQHARIFQYLNWKSIQISFTSFKLPLLFLFSASNLGISYLLSGYLKLWEVQTILSSVTLSISLSHGKYQFLWKIKMIFIDTLESIIWNLNKCPWIFMGKSIDIAAVTFKTFLCVYGWFKGTRVISVWRPLNNGGQEYSALRRVHPPIRLYILCFSLKIT